MNDFLYCVQVVDHYLLSDEVLETRYFQTRFRLCLYLIYFVYRKYRDWDTATILIYQRRLSING